VKDIYFGKTDKTPGSMAFVVNSTSIGNNFQLFFKTADNMSEKALEFLSENWQQVDPVATFFLKKEIFLADLQPTVLYRSILD
jgi:hypothetical protein